MNCRLSELVTVPVGSLEDATISATDIRADLRLGPHVKMAPGAHCHSPKMGSSSFPARNHGQHNVTGLNAERFFLTG